jgi:hypothetical protein
MLERSRNLVVIATALVLSLAPIQNVLAQDSAEVETFFSRICGVIAVRFDASGETVPGGNIAAELWINCRAMDVNIVSFEFSVYGFQFGKEKILLDSQTVMENVDLGLNETMTYNYSFPVSTDVWGVTYTDLYLNYTVPNLSIPSFKSGFFTTLVRNTYLEELEDMFERLNQTYHELSETFWRSFKMDLTGDNLGSLNQTYWGLKQNYTSFAGSRSELENTRTVAVILGITTAFFVATTLYLIWRKPKDYW